MFGFNDVEFKYIVQFMVWKIKCFINDEFWQCFVDIIVLQVEFFGLIILDEYLKYNEEIGYYDFGFINWDEFWQVVSGEGFCNW